VAVAIALSLLGACDAGFNAQTNVPYQPAQGISNRSGDVYSINTLVVADDSGNGTVVARLVNQQAGPDQLLSFTAVDPTGTPVTAGPLSSPIDIAAYPSQDQSVQVGTSGALRVSGDQVTPGSYLTLTLTFAHAAPVQVDAPILRPGTIYADIPVGPAPTPASGSVSG
jgi:hypothetical protein